MYFIRMGSNDASTRRRFVIATAGATITGMAGCLGGGGGENDESSGEMQDGGKYGGGRNDSTNDGSGMGGGNSETDGSAGSKTVTVSIISNRFDPQVQELAVGDTVEFVCEEGFHTATLYHPDNGSLPNRAPSGAGAFESGNLSSGNSFEVTLDTAGVYDYFCRPHEDEGMVGTLVVGENTDPNQPGLSAPANVPEEAAAHLRQLNDQARSILGIGGGGNNDGGNGNVGGGENGDRQEEIREIDGEIATLENEIDRFEQEIEALDENDEEDREEIEDKEEEIADLEAEIRELEREKAQLQQ
jgi:plastocyanin